MPDNTVQLHVSTGSAQHDRALAEQLFADVRARGVDAEWESGLVRFAAHSSAVVEVVPEGYEQVNAGCVRLMLGAEDGVDAAVDSRAIVDELECHGLLARHDEVYSEDEEAAVARRLEELGYLG